MRQEMTQRLRDSYQLSIFQFGIHGQAEHVLGSEFRMDQIAMVNAARVGRLAMDRYGIVYQGPNSFPFESNLDKVPPGCADNKLMVNMHRTCAGIRQNQTRPAKG